MARFTSENAAEHGRCGGQRDRHPAHLRDKIAVIFDGIDTDVQHGT